MTFLRLLAATCFLPTVIPSSSLRSATGQIERSLDDPTLIVGEAAAAAIADQKAFYESLKEEYIKEDCSKIWGEFPSATSTTTTSAMIVSHHLDGGMMCSCGMIYDLAASALFQEEEDVVASASEGAIWGIDFLRSSASTQMTRLDSWIMARTKNSKAECSGGFAAGYPCKNVDLLVHLPLNALSANNIDRRSPTAANDVWGWTSSESDGSREFVIWGVTEGTFFFEVADFDLILMGYLPSTTNDFRSQHDMKVNGDYAYMGSESAKHGIQIFNMRRLLTVDPKSVTVRNQELTWDKLYTGTTDFPVANSHNVVINEESNFLYIVGGQNGCSGGLHIVDVSNPLNPTFVACFDGDGYVHDAQCVNYKGADPNYNSNDSEICFCFNADKVTIVDVTDKRNIKIISRTEYEDAKYTHQGWLSSNQSHVVFGDELDEREGNQVDTRTLVINVKDLANPTNVEEFLGTSTGIDHNQYIVEVENTSKGRKYKPTDMIYQADYSAGLRILQVIDYETTNFKEVGYFDTFPYSNEGKFEGAWSSFPYFQSGVVAISSIKEGLFLVKPDLGCNDVSFRYKKQKRKNCNWVKQKNTKRKCKKKWLEGKVSDYCRGTCGKKGLGRCANNFQKL